MIKAVFLVPGFIFAGSIAVAIIIALIAAFVLDGTEFGYVISYTFEIGFVF